MSVSDKEITVYLTARTRKAHCPTCQRLSRLKHGSYERTARTLPHGLIPVTLRVRLPRFVCSNPHCTRRTFSTPLSELPPFARQTRALNQVVEAIGFSTGSRAGARLAAQCHIPTSRTTLLRRLHRAAIPQQPTPRVLAVDDFALRKGRRYGTILLDLETHSPVDLLLERTAASLAGWLREHPGVEIISRDRGGPYAQGAREGAPDAAQVADRWHLLKNLGDTVERFFIHHHRAVQAAQESLPASTSSVAETAQQLIGAVGVQPGSGEFPPRKPGLNKAERESQSRRERRLQRYEQVCALHDQGVSRRAIAKRLELSRVTVSRYIKGGTFPEQARRRPRSPLLEPYLSFVHEHYPEGCPNVSRLFEELRERGYRGSSQRLQRSLHALGIPSGRRQHSPSGTSGGAARRQSRPVSAHQLRWLYCRRPEDLDSEEKRRVSHLVSVSKECDVLYEMTQRFTAMIRLRDPQKLETWLQEALASPITELRSFAEGLRSDLAAVRAGITGAWSNGPTEGAVNRLKFLKRQMYGRASFHLLRQRVLHPN